MTTCELLAFGANYESGPRHVGSAWNIYRGALYLSGQGRFYAKQDIFTGPNGIESGVTVWDSQTSAGIYWGVANHWQIGVIPIISQKNHQSDDESDSPGDVLLNLKLGSIGPYLAPLKMALQLDLRLPTGATHNIPLNPYAAGAVGFGGMGLLSINSRPGEPQSGFSLDVNLGYFNHNDKGIKLTDNEADTIMTAAATQELIVGTALRIMGKKLGFFTEAHGRYFLQPPPATAYTRENSLYVTPGFIYQFNPYIRIESSIDILLQGKDDETLYEENGVRIVQKPWETVPNLPEWRFNFGVSLRLKKGKPPQPRQQQASGEPAKTEQVKKGSKKKSKKQQQRDIRAMEERLKQKSRQEQESEALRRERMQRERERMEALLKKLREELQKEKNQQEE